MLLVAMDYRGEAASHGLPDSHLCALARWLATRLHLALIHPSAHSM